MAKSSRFRKREVARGIHLYTRRVTLAIARIPTLTEIVGEPSDAVAADCKTILPLRTLYVVRNRDGYYAVVSDAEALGPEIQGSSATFDRAHDSGQNRGHVIAAMEANHPKLTTQESFYVEISRARDRAELVTDDAAALMGQLEAVTGERTSALEGIGESVQPEQEKDEKVSGMELKAREDSEPSLPEPEMEPVPNPETAPEPGPPTVEKSFEWELEL